MISDAGAALIATVYPIGLLIVIVNRRDLVPNPPTTPRRRKIRVLIETVRGLAIIGAVVSVVGCMIAVSMEVPIRNSWYVLGVALSGLVIGISAMSVLQDLDFVTAKKLMSVEQIAIAPGGQRTLSRLAVRRVGARSGRLAGRRANHSKASR